MKVLWINILRGVQALLAALVLALAIVSIVMFYVPGFYPSQSAFLAFNGVWTLLVVLYFLLAPRFAPVIANVYVRLGIDAVTTVFWFAGFIALAVAVAASAEVVGGIINVNPLDGEQNLTGMSPDIWFQASAAAAGFGGLEWALFVVSTTLTSVELYRGRKSSPNPQMAEGNSGEIISQEQFMHLGG